MTRKITPAQLDEIEAVAKKVMPGGLGVVALDPPTALALIARLREAEQMVRLLRDVYQAKCDRIVAFAGLAPDDLDDSMDMEAVEEMVAARIEKAEAKVERVEAIHRPMRVVLYPGTSERVMEVCAECRTRSGDLRPWPCPTIRALDAN